MLNLHLLPFFLIAIFVHRRAAALGIPREQLQQRPLSPMEYAPKPFGAASIILGLTVVGSDEERYVEFPLRQVISAGTKPLSFAIL